MEAWREFPAEPIEEPLDIGRNNNDNTVDNPGLPSTTGFSENSDPPGSAVMEQSPPANVADAFKRIPTNGGLAEAAMAGETTTTAAATAATVPITAAAHGAPPLMNDDPGAQLPCRRNYLVMGRLFKLHPDFDGAIEGILAGDTGGCVVLIHETKDEEWTRAVWSRLKEVLVPQGEDTYSRGEGAL